MGIIRNGAGRSLYQVGGNVVAEGTLTAGVSPLTVAVDSVLIDNGVLTNGNNGYIINDSTVDTPVSFTVQIAHKGTSYLTAFTVKQGEVFDLAGWDVANIKLTRVSADCAYRIQVW